MSDLVIKNLRNFNMRAYRRIYLDTPFQLYEEFSPQGFRLFAVAMAYDPPNRVVETARNWKLPYPVVLDLKADIAQAFGSSGQIPAHFLIAPDGSVALHQLGRMDVQKVRFLICEILEKSSV